MTQGDEEGCVSGCVSLIVLLLLPVACVICACWLFDRGKDLTRIADALERAYPVKELEGKK